MPVLVGIGNITEINKVADSFNQPPAADWIEDDPKTKKPRGRHQGIEDPKLLSNRHVLLSLLEGTWGSVGLNLRKVKKSDDVRRALTDWEPHRDANPIVATLLRPSERFMDIKRLRAMQSVRGKLVDSLYAADGRRHRCQEDLQKVEHLFAHELTPEQRATAEEQRIKRRTALERAEEEYLANQRKLNDLDEEIKDGRAYIARAQVVQFCRSGRYSINPENAANAFAGLPDIGYRQSIKRCRLHKPIYAGGGAYQIVRVLQRIVGSRQNMTLVKHTERWLRKTRLRKPREIFAAIKELRKKWYYLKPAIEETVRRKFLSRELPYLIATEFYRRMSARTPVDSFFEEECRIVPDKIVSSTKSTGLPPFSADDKP